MQPPSCSEKPAGASSAPTAPSWSRRWRRFPMTHHDAFARHLHTFFHEYLIAQRSVSPHTVLAYRDALKLLLRFAAERLGKPVTGLELDNLNVETVLDFLDHLERERNN